MKSAELTQSILKEMLSYCPDSGVFTRLKSVSRNTKAGDVAGHINSRGYVRIMINGNLYYAHRLAYFFFYGVWPANDIDHVNGDKSDNRIINLREATRSQNEMNKSASSNNTSGFKGVSWHKASKKWQVRCKVNFKDVWIGYFATPELASEAYQAFAKSTHGDFYHGTVSLQGS